MCNDQCAHVCNCIIGGVMVILRRLIRELRAIPRERTHIRRVQNTYDHFIGQNCTRDMPARTPFKKYTSMHRGTWQHDGTQAPTLTCKLWCALKVPAQSTQVPGTDSAWHGTEAGLAGAWLGLLGIVDRLSFMLSMRGGCWGLLIGLVSC